MWRTCSLKQTKNDPSRPCSGTVRKWASSILDHVPFFFIEFLVTHSMVTCGEVGLL